LAPLMVQNQKASGIEEFTLAFGMMQSASDLFD
jgi:hypothetical protein